MISPIKTHLHTGVCHRAERLDYKAEKEREQSADQHNQGIRIKFFLHAAAPPIHKVV